MEYRSETDSMGSIEVPQERYYGAQTARSLMHFQIGTERMPRELIWAMGILNKAAALTNKELGVLPADKADLIVRAAEFAGWPPVRAAALANLPFRGTNRAAPSCPVRSTRRSPKP